VWIKDTINCLDVQAVYAIFFYSKYRLHFLDASISFICMDIKIIQKEKRITKTTRFLEGIFELASKNARKYGISFSRYAEGAVFERNERLRKKNRR